MPDETTAENGTTPESATTADPGGGVSFGELARIPGIAPAALLVLLAFAGFSLLLPVVPLAVVRSGGSELLAGATTGVFMAVTVAVQILTPALTARIGYRGVMLLGATLLGVPAVALPAADPATGAGAALVVAVCAVRGSGFGMMTVAGSALVAELAPPRMLGRASSLVGLAVGVSEAVFLPLGLALFQRQGLVAVVAPAVVLGLVGLVAGWYLPRVHPHTEAGSATPGPSARRLAGALAAPFVVMLAVSVPYGATASFLSPALDALRSGEGAVVAGVALGLLGAAVVVGRTVAGSISDRRGPRVVVAPALVVAVLGMGGIALALRLGVGPWWFLLPAAVFGAGFGAVQNSALVASFERVPRSRLGTASASWNVSFDAGTGLGSLCLGALAPAGFPALFTAATAVVVVLGVASLYGIRAPGAAPGGDSVAP